MLVWALFFLMISLIAGTLGFVGLAGLTATFFWILSGVFLVIFFVALVANLFGGRRTTY